MCNGFYNFKKNLSPDLFTNSEVQQALFSNIDSSEALKLMEYIYLINNYIDNCSECNGSDFNTPCICVTKRKT